MRWSEKRRTTRKCFITVVYELAHWRCCCYVSCWLAALKVRSCINPLWRLKTLSWTAPTIVSSKRSWNCSAKGLEENVINKRFSGVAATENAFDWSKPFRRVEYPLECVPIGQRRPVLYWIIKFFVPLQFEVSLQCFLASVSGERAWLSVTIVKENSTHKKLRRKLNFMLSVLTETNVAGWLSFSRYVQ